MLPPLSREELRDILGQLSDWSGGQRELRRTMWIDEGEHAALTERIQVVADALQRRPDVRRVDGRTEIRVRHPEGSRLTSAEVSLAARIEDAYRLVTTHN